MKLIKTEDHLFLEEEGIVTAYKPSHILALKFNLPLLPFNFEEAEPKGFKPEYETKWVTTGMCMGGEVEGYWTDTKFIKTKENKLGEKEVVGKYIY